MVNEFNQYVPGGVGGERRKKGEGERWGERGREEGEERESGGGVGEWGWRRKSEAQASPMSSSLATLDLAAFAYSSTRWSTMKRPSPSAVSLSATVQRPRVTAAVKLSSESRPPLEDDGSPAAAELHEPFIASGEGKWRERYASVSLAAFEARVPCKLHVEKPLRALLVGHNPCARHACLGCRAQKSSSGMGRGWPACAFDVCSLTLGQLPTPASHRSETAWRNGVGYSNPTNRFWRLMREGGVLPAEWRPEDAPRELNNAMPGELGIGITDYILAPGGDYCLGNALLPSRSSHSCTLQSEATTRFRCHPSDCEWRPSVKVPCHSLSPELE